MWKGPAAAWRRAIVVAAVSMAATVAPAGAQTEDDRRLADAVAAAVRTCPQFGIFDHVAGEVHDGVVTLNGKVTVAAKKEELERRVSRLDGVRAVQSAIDVLPASREDDDLRIQIARAIYGHATFWSYAAMPHPPIHIIVEHGRVTLTGVVGSPAERLTAITLARGRAARDVVDELRTAAARGARFPR